MIWAYSPCCRFGVRIYGFSLHLTAVGLLLVELRTTRGVAARETSFPTSYRNQHRFLHPLDCGFGADLWDLDRPGNHRRLQRSVQLVQFPQCARQRRGGDGGESVSVGDAHHPERQRHAQPLGEFREFRVSNWEWNRLDHISRRSGRGDRHRSTRSTHSLYLDRCHRQPDSRSKRADQDRHGQICGQRHQHIHRGYTHP